MILDDLFTLDRASNERDMGPICGKCGCHDVSVIYRKTERTKLQCEGCGRRWPWDTCRPYR